MGTRSLTIFKDDNKEIGVMYRQYDGYPSGHGIELSEFLSDMIIVNGLSSDQPNKVANGMGCLSAQVVAHFKDEPGNIYLYAPNTRHVWEEYIYEIYGNENEEVRIKVFEAGWEEHPTKELFEGTAKEVLNWCKQQE